MRAPHPWFLWLALASQLGCSGHSMIMPNPPESAVRVDGKPLAGNALRYGRWIGNSYDVEVSSPGFKTQRIEASPELGDRAGAIALVCAATVFGIPLIPFLLPFNGELDDRIYVSLEPIHP
jgi:hypothetical protein